MIDQYMVASMLDVNKIRCGLCAEDLDFQTQQFTSHTYGKWHKAYGADFVAGKKQLTKSLAPEYAQDDEWPAGTQFGLDASALSIENRYRKQTGQTEIPLNAQPPKPTSASWASQPPPVAPTVPKPTPATMNSDGVSGNMPMPPPPMPRVQH